jgi:hypothetical protein
VSRSPVRTRNSSFSSRVRVVKWVVPAEGGKPERSGYLGGGWSINTWTGDGVYVVSGEGDAANIYRVPLDASGTRRSGKVSGRI